jgi:hypothetical protein
VTATEDLCITARHAGVCDLDDPNPRLLLPVSLQADGAQVSAAAALPGMLNPAQMQQLAMTLGAPGMAANGATALAALQQHVQQAAQQQQQQQQQQQAVQSGPPVGLPSSSTPMTGQAAANAVAWANQTPSADGGGSGDGEVRSLHTSVLAPGMSAMQGPGIVTSGRCLCAATKVPLFTSHGFVRLILMHAHQTCSRGMSGKQSGCGGSKATGSPPAGRA